MLVTIAHSSEQ